MPVSKELRDVVELLGQYDERYQKMAVSSLLGIVNRAEQTIADSHLSREERRAVERERRAQEGAHQYEKHRQRMIRWLGEEEAAAMEAKFDELKRRDRQARKDLGLE